MSKDLENFRQQIVEKKHPLTYTLLKCLNFVEIHPEYASQIGCLWNSNDSISMNSIIFSNFISRNVPTVHKYLRYTGFRCNKMSSNSKKQIPEKFNFQNFSHQSNWHQRLCKGFNKNTTDDEARNMKYKLKHIKNPNN